MAADTTFAIDGRPIGPDQTVYVVAEMSGNHDQDLDTAREIVRAAAGAGADAVKLQTYRPDTMTIDCDREPFRVKGGTLWDGQTLYGLYAKAMTPWEWQPELKNLAEDLGIDLFSTAFDRTAVDFLEEMDVPVHKVASFEILDLELIAHMAERGRPVILSTGMATVEEIDEAVRVVRDHGDPPLALLRCNSAYPADPAEMDLRTIPDMMDRWDVPVGLSDHTLGPTSAIAAVALGACIVEKHFTLDRSAGGPDADFSMEPDEFREMVEAIRAADDALGEVRYGPTEDEEASRVFRRSLFVVEDVAEGEALTRDNVRSIRPGHGLAPKRLSAVLGRRASTDIPRGTPLAWSHIEGATPEEDRGRGHPEEGDA